MKLSTGVQKFCETLQSFGLSRSAIIALVVLLTANDAKAQTTTNNLSAPAKIGEIVGEKVNLNELIKELNLSDIQKDTLDNSIKLDSTGIDTLTVDPTVSDTLDEQVYECGHDKICSNGKTVAENIEEGKQKRNAKIIQNYGSMEAYTQAMRTQYPVWAANMDKEKEAALSRAPSCETRQRTILTPGISNISPATRTIYANHIANGPANGVTPIQYETLSNIPLSTVFGDAYNASTNTLDVEKAMIWDDIHPDGTPTIVVYLMSIGAVGANTSMIYVSPTMILDYLGATGTARATQGSSNLPMANIDVTGLHAMIVAKRLANDNLNAAVMEHEFGHALSLIHSQIASPNAMRASVNVSDIVYAASLLPQFNTAINNARNQGYYFNCSVLPIELLDQKVRYVNCKDLEVYFKVATENNIDSYIIEVSNDEETWTAMLTVESQGDGHDHTYKELIPNYEAKEKDLYVRIKSIENDGTVENQPIMNVTIDNECKKKGVNIHRNGSDQNELFIEDSHNDGDDLEEVTIISVDGKNMGRFECSDGSCTIDLSNQPSGMYIVMVKVDGIYIPGGKVVKN